MIDTAGSDIVALINVYLIWTSYKVLVEMIDYFIHLNLYLSFEELTLHFRLNDHVIRCWIF